MADSSPQDPPMLSPDERRIKSYNELRDRYMAMEKALYDQGTSLEYSQQFREWIDKSKEAIFKGFDEGEQKLSELENQVAVPAGGYWTPKSLAKHCNLMLDEKRLIRRDKSELPQDRPLWRDVIKLTSTLTNLKTKGFISKKQVNFIEQVEQHLKGVFFEGRELRRITEALATKLSEEIENQTMTADLTKHEQVISDLIPDLENCESLLQASLLNGDMAMAEEIAYNQAALHQRILGIVQEQYPIIRQRQEDSKEFKRRRRWAVFRMANRDVASVVELKCRQIEACEDDTQKIKYQIMNYSQDDLQHRRRYDLQRAESDKVLHENQLKQQDVWARITQLGEELQRCQEELKELSTARWTEVQRRIKMDEEEEGRRSGHSGFLATSETYLSNLEATVENACKAKDLCKAINDFILDGCDNVALKFDRSEAVLNEMSMRVNKQYLKQFTDYYLAVGRLKYKKEKRRKLVVQAIEENHIKQELSLETMDPLARKYALQKQQLFQERKALDQEIDCLTARMTVASQDFEEVAEALKELNIPFVHPKVILEKSDIDREKKILDYRDLTNLTETKVERELEHEAQLLLKEKEDHKLRVRAAKYNRRKGLEPKPPSEGVRQGRIQAASYQRYEALCKNVLAKIDDQPGGIASPAADKGQVVEAAAQSPERPEASLPRRLEGRLVRALYPYKAAAPDELSFEKGDNIVVINEGGEEGWYYGICNQVTGVFPVNYVALAEEE